MGSRERLFKGGVLGCQWKQPSRKGENDNARGKRKAGGKNEGLRAENGVRVQGRC